MNPVKSGMLAVATAALMALAAACGGDDGDGAGGAGNAGTGGTGTGGTGTGGAGTGGSGGGASGSCSVASPCPNMGHCIFPQGSCDAAATGTCQDAYSCDGPPTGPVCGCDGNVVEGESAECRQWGDSLPYADPDLCATGTFACGTLSCRRHVEVCLTISGGITGMTTYECVPLSQVQGTCAHGIADCSCMDLSMYGGAMCKADADFQETIDLALP